jgi:hypothetical protein
LNQDAALGQFGTDPDGKSSADAKPLVRTFSGDYDAPQFTMKTLFAVTFDKEEPPHLCIANSEIEARYMTLERLRELELSIRGELLVEKEGIYPNIDDFERLYSLRRNSHDPMSGLGGTLFGTSEIEWKTVCQSPPGTIWTLVENDEMWWVSPGIHFVNRLGYLLTNEERIGDEIQYLYE